MKSHRFVSYLLFLLAIMILVFPMQSFGEVFPVTVTDSSGKQITFSGKPQRVVCLVPYVTEMLVKFGQDQSIAGLIDHDLILNSGLRKKNVGSYFSIDMQAVADCDPDLIIAPSSNREVVRRFGDGPCKVMIMKALSIEEAFSHMEMIGRIFDCEDKAKAVIQRNRDQMVLVKARMESVPAKDRKRVVRVMAADELSCPGDDSFQNEVITAAGGIVPRWGKDGFAVAVDLEEWKDFDPQFIYGCHLNEKAVRSLLGREGWRDVDAVRTGSVAMFPCDLTCRVSTRVGAFVQWMAAVIYPDIFADPERAVLQNSVLERKPIALDSAYVEKAEVVKHRVADAEFKSLVLRFKRPQAALSTFEGFLSDIEAVGNTYIPMHASLGHMAYGVDRARKDIAKNLGYDEGKYSGLMTGANMDNLSVQKRTFEDLEATAFVTAGVRGNAMRMSKDSGIYCKPGTINIIVLTNRRLTPNAMARTIITATEAKSAALLDLDIRSSYNRDFRATGTGTDNVMIVQGEGPEERLAGGHDKIAELVAKAVHAGVTEAIARQNGIKADRDLFQRLEDRRLNLDRVVRCYRGDDTAKSLSSELRKILEVPYYASFIESAFAISDDYEKGLIKEPDFFDDACCLVAARLSKRPEFSLNKIPVPDGLPTIMAKAFGALIAGISEKDGDSDNRGEH